MVRITPREREVLDRVCEGATSKAIAHELGITEQAVKAHIHHLFEKFSVTNRASLAAAATGARVDRRQAISDKYHERARSLGREVSRLQRANTRLRSGAKKAREARSRRG